MTILVVFSVSRCGNTKDKPRIIIGGYSDDDNY